MKGTQVSVTSGISSEHSLMPRAQSRPSPCDFAQDRPAEALGLAGVHGHRRRASGLCGPPGCPGLCRGWAVGCSSHGGHSVCVRRGPCAPPGARGGRCPCCGRAWPLAAVPARSSWSQLCGPAGPCHSLPLRTGCAGLCPGPFLSGMWAAVHGGHPVWVETPQSADCVTVPDGPCGSLEREC